MLPVDILGVNMPGYGMAPLMYAGKPLSWMRDTAALNLTASWGAVFRDVMILDPLNRKVDTYNAYTLPLDGAGNAANRAVLKGRLLAAATPADTDNDKLPDYWEQWAFGNLTRDGAGTDAAGLKTLQHYAHCGATTGVPPAGLPRIFLLPDGSVSVLYTRRRGTAFGLICLPEFSTGLTGWSGTTPAWEEWSLRPLYDGSGGEIVEWKSPVPGATRYVRIRATLP